jgi:hypothetical protein
MTIIVFAVIFLVFLLFALFGERVIRLLTRSDRGFGSRVTDRDSAEDAAIGVRMVGALGAALSLAILLAMLAEQVLR